MNNETTKLDQRDKKTNENENEIRMGERLRWMFKGYVCNRITRTRQRISFVKGKT